MRILLDTNVLFSGFGFRGVMGQFLEELVLQEHTIVTSEFILEELREKIRLKFKGPQTEAALDLLLSLLSHINLDVAPVDVYKPYVSEAMKFVPEQDAPILAIAMLDDVDYLATGDKRDFLENPKLKETPWAGKIIHPRELMKIL